jgi:pimeloyl-ACP methyl ester carboxylesterase
MKALIRKVYAIALLALLGTAVGSGPLQAQEKFGVILMHGKQGSPTSSGTGLPSIASTLQAHGHKVLVPSMPWSAGGWESIRITVDQAFDLIDGYAAQLRAQGVTRIVVGGHSLGANIALSYAVERGNVAGVVMMAPGHSPAFLWRTSDAFKKTFERAVELVKAGQGNTSLTGIDNNQGNNISLSTNAAAYASWMNPRGQASMDAQAPRLPASIPLFLVIGEKDPSFPRAKSAWYQPAAKNPYSKYVEVGADHFTTPFAASKQIVDWIDGLPK